MRIIHTIASVDQEAAGPSYSVPMLCSSLATKHTQVVLASLGEHHRDLGENAEHCLFPRNALGSRLEMSTKLKKWLAYEVPKADIVHGHNLWTMPNLYGGKAALANNKPYVVSPRGTLHPKALSISEKKKRAFGFLLQNKYLHGASVLHATSEEEAVFFRDFGLKQPIIVLPNGMDIPEIPAPNGGDSRSQTKKAVFFGRVHPIKGLPRLLYAWSTLQQKALTSDWELVIAGTGEERYISDLKELVRELGLKGVTFSGPIYGPEKFRFLHEADLYVLPTNSENFGMTIVEALACGTPVITTRGAPWAKLEQFRCGWWADVSVEGVRLALEAALLAPANKLKTMGERGRNLVKAEFSWAMIGTQMLSAYQWAIEGSESSSAPSCVLVD